MKHLIYIIGIILALLPLQSCVDEENQANTPRGNFEALWQIIDSHYCFLDYKGIDWNEVKARYSERIADHMTSAQLFEVLTDMLSELKDGHVNLYCAGDIARYWKWYEDYDKNLDVELRDKYLGHDYSIASGLKYRILDDNVGYVMIESFNAGMGEGNISQMLYNLQTCNGLIIDVRGNGGGRMDNARRLASHFTNERLLVGYTIHKTGPGHNDFSEPWADHMSPSESVRWQKPVVVLTNRECYSATNTFVRDMKRCPLVTTLGDKTGGGSGMPFSAELPNGWQVRYSAEPCLDVNKQHIEFGIAPDRPCALDSLQALQGHDTLIEEARRLLK